MGTDTTLEQPESEVLLPVGTLIAGRYRIDGVLGEGGMGIVFAATQVELERKVAIKFLRAEKREKSAAGRFLREARAAVRLESEHVARVFDVGEHEVAGPFMVMEYLTGTDLETRLSRDGRVEVAEAIDLMLQACDAIGAAHVHRIIHRDLKPANMFLSPTSSGRQFLKVLDFGISKVPKEEGDAWTTTESGRVFGSPQYMSPEQIASTTDVDGRTDIWSLSVVLYEILTGRAPFEAPSVAATLVKVVSGVIPPPSQHRDGLPPELDAVVMRGLERRPEDRFQTIEEMGEALAAARDACAARNASSPRVVIAAAVTGASLETLGLAETVKETVKEAVKEAEPRRKPRRSSSRDLVLFALAGLVFVAGAFALRAKNRVPVTAPSSAVSAPVAAVDTSAPANAPSASAASAPAPLQGASTETATPEAPASTEGSAPRPAARAPHASSSGRKPHAPALGKPTAPGVGTGGDDVWGR